MSRFRLFFTPILRSTRVRERSDFSATRPSTQHRIPTVFTVTGAGTPRDYCARG
jgi:hypothetical protein